MKWSSPSPDSDHNTWRKAAAAQQSAARRRPPLLVSPVGSNVRCNSVSCPEFGGDLDRCSSQLHCDRLPYDRKVRSRRGRDKCWLSAAGMPRRVRPSRRTQRRGPEPPRRGLRRRRTTAGRRLCSARCPRRVFKTALWGLVARRVGLQQRVRRVPGRRSQRLGAESFDGVIFTGGLGVSIAGRRLRAV